PYSRGNARLAPAVITDPNTLPTGVDANAIDGSTAPAAGSFDWYAGPGGTYFRLGSYLQGGQITCDAVEGVSAADRTVAQIFKRVLVDRGGIDPA
ncbi:hypothetical protein ABTH28_17840, partial [Acinetobacter baumannii]